MFGDRYCYVFVVFVEGLVVGMVREVEVDVFVFVQGFWLQWLVMLIEVGWCCVEYMFQDQQWVGDQVGVCNLVVIVQGQVDVFGDQVLVVVLQEQFQVQVWIMLEKGWNGWGQVGEGEGQWGVDLQQVVGVLLY